MGPRSKIPATQEGGFSRLKPHASSARKFLRTEGGPKARSTHGSADLSGRCAPFGFEAHLTDGPYH